MNHADLWQSFGRTWQKVKIKDAWGSEYFMVRGLPPDFLAGVPAPARKEKILGKKTKDITFEEIREANKGDKTRPLTPKAMVAILESGEVINLLEVTEGWFLQGQLYLMIEEFYPEAKLSYDGSIVTWHKDDQVVAYCKPMRTQGKLMSTSDYLKSKLEVPDGVGISGDGARRNDDCSGGS